VPSCVHYNLHQTPLQMPSTFGMFIILKFQNKQKKAQIPSSAHNLPKHIWNTKRKIKWCEVPHHFAIRGVIEPASLTKATEACAHVIYTVRLTKSLWKLSLASCIYAFLMWLHCHLPHCFCKTLQPNVLLISNLVQKNLMFKELLLKLQDLFHELLLLESCVIHKQTNTSIELILECCDYLQNRENTNRHSSSSMQPCVCKKHTVQKPNPDHIPLWMCH
jgi:hypothetical protein